MPSLIALLGAANSGRHALLHALQPRLDGTAFEADVIEDASSLGSLQRPALVLLLAPQDLSGEAQVLHWRQRLVQAGLAYSVLHGDAQSRLDDAWRLIQPLLGQAPSRSNEELVAGRSARRWTWSCDKCSDPTCEHRLFQDLVQARRDAAGSDPTH